MHLICRLLSAFCFDQRSFELSPEFLELFDVRVELKLKLVELLVSELVFRHRFDLDVFELVHGDVNLADLILVDCFHFTFDNNCGCLEVAGVAFLDL